MRLVTNFRQHLCQKKEKREQSQIKFIVFLFHQTKKQKEKLGLHFQAFD